MNHRMVATLLTALLAPGPALAEESSLIELARGIEQVRAGEYEDALVTLDGAALVLSAQPTTQKDAARAYLYLGVAYTALKQPALAATKFRQVMRLDPTFRLDETAFAFNVVKAFGQAQLESRREVIVAQRAKRKTGKGALIVLTAGGAAAAGIAALVATKGAPANRPPTGSLAFFPPGNPIVSVTNVTLSASPRDADTELVVVNWDFGDGTTDTGPTIDHIFSRSGAVTVTANISDGKADSTLTLRLQVVTLTGRWQSNPGYGGETDFNFTQIQSAITGTAEAGVPPPPIDAGVLATPRVARFRYRYRREFRESGFLWPVDCYVNVSGNVDETGDRITTTASCGGCSLRNVPPEIDCGHRPAMTMTFIRR